MANHPRPMKHSVSVASHSLVVLFVALIDQASGFLDSVKFHGGEHGSWTIEYWRAEEINLEEFGANQPALMLTREELGLLRRLLTRASYSMIKLPGDEQVETAEALMQSITARTGIDFERLT